jgi:hypothetical protein
VQAEYELLRGASARDKLNMETEYALFTPFLNALMLISDIIALNGLINNAD